MQLTTEGIVIRETPSGDDHRLLTILTKEKGVITAYAKSARRIKSSLAAGTELLTHSSFVLFKNRDRYMVDRADVENIFFGIRQDIEKLALASYLAQLCSQLVSEEDIPNSDYLRLMLNSLYMLDRGQRNIWQIKPLFELRIMSMSGYMPDLVQCRSCGCFEGEQMFFMPRSGELSCQGCLTPANILPIRVPKGVLAAMRYIIYSDFDKLFNFSLPQEGLWQLSAISQKYVLEQLERSLPSLDFFLQLAGTQIERSLYIYEAGF